jgi:hypothetical protein
MKPGAIRTPPPPLTAARSLLNADMNMYGEMVALSYRFPDIF